MFKRKQKPAVSMHVSAGMLSFKLKNRKPIPGGSSASGETKHPPIQPQYIFFKNVNCHILESNTFKRVIGAVEAEYQDAYKQQFKNSQ